MAWTRASHTLGLKPELRHWAAVTVVRVPLKNRTNGIEDRGDLLQDWLLRFWRPRNPSGALCELETKERKGGDEAQPESEGPSSRGTDGPGLRVDVPAQGEKAHLPFPQHLVPSMDWVMPTLARWSALLSLLLQMPLSYRNTLTAHPEIMCFQLPVPPLVQSS